MVPPAAPSVIWLNQVPCAMKKALFTVLLAAMTSPRSSVPAHTLASLGVLGAGEEEEEEEEEAVDLDKPDETSAATAAVRMGVATASPRSTA